MSCEVPPLPAAFAPEPPSAAARPADDAGVVSEPALLVPLWPAAGASGGFVAPRGAPSPTPASSAAAGGGISVSTQPPANTTQIGTTQLERIGTSPFSRIARFIDRARRGLRLESSRNSTRPMKHITARTARLAQA